MYNKFLNSLGFRVKLLYIFSILFACFSSLFDLITLLFFYVFINSLISPGVSPSSQLFGFIPSNVTSNSIVIVLSINLFLKVASSYFQSLVNSSLASELSENVYLTIISMDRFEFSGKEITQSEISNLLVAQFNLFVAGILMPLSSFISNTANILFLLIGSFLVSIKFSSYYLVCLVLPSLITYIIISKTVFSNG